MEIVNCDAIKYIDCFADNTFDCVILDPDYNNWDELIECGLLDKVIRVTKETGNILTFTKQPFDFNLRVAVDEYFRREIVWTFENGGAWCSKKMPLISTQKIYWLTKSKDFFFNPRTGIPYSPNTKDFKRSTKVFGNYISEGRDFRKDEGGTWLRDHLHYNKPRCGKIPAKPKELIEILLRCFCPDGGVVLDPFAGSGVVSLIGDQLGMDVYSSEIDGDRVNAILDKHFELVGER